MNDFWLVAFFLSSCFSRNVGITKRNPRNDHRPLALATAALLVLVAGVLVRLACCAGKVNASAVEAQRQMQGGLSFLDVVIGG